MCSHTDVLQERGLVVQLVTLFLLGEYVKWRSRLAVVTINLEALHIRGNFGGLFRQFFQNSCYV